MAKRMFGWQDLPQFEDKVLYHVVDLAGDMPMAEWRGIKEADVLARLSEELGVPADFGHDEHYVGDEAHEILWASFETLKRDGLTDHTAHFGPDNEVRPTRDGRRRVQEWREEWARNRQALDKRIQRRILEELDVQRRDKPQQYEFSSKVDVERLCKELGIAQQEYLANALRLIQQGRIAELPIEQADVADGWVHITEAGIGALEASVVAERPQRDVQEAWVEVARLRRELQLAKRNLPSLITDEELRSRCSDLLTAEGHYDRAIREACVILEDRVRKAARFGNDKIGTGLMEMAFSPKGGPLQLSDHEQEQLGFMLIYKGIMAAYRNSAGHNIVDSYTQEDALRFVGTIDLLLDMVGRVVQQVQGLQSAQGPQSLAPQGQPQGSN